MKALFHSLFFPNKQAIQFAIKGVIAMALSIYIAMFLNLERPYWALIGAMFLQIRPESGLVVEKGICQIIGSMVGAAVGIAILNWFAPYPEIAIGLLALWLGINSGLSALVRRVNFIYAFAMAGMTACLICLMVMIQPDLASSQNVFALAQARISEIIVGVVCATLVSKLIWPISIREGVQQHAKQAINQTLSYLALEIDAHGSHQERHKSIDGILETVTLLNDNSSAVSFEGPEGPGQSRAANAICNSILSTLAIVQIFGRLQRLHPELMGDVLTPILAAMRRSFNQMAASHDDQECYSIIKSLRRELLEYTNSRGSKTPIQVRLIKMSLELTAEITLQLQAYAKLTRPQGVILNAPRIKSHRDPLVGITTGLRSVILFLVGAGIWVGTGSSSVLMIMILPVVFSIMMARLPMAILSIVLKRILVGILFAIPLAIFYAIPLLASSSGDYELLVMILAGPYFLGLLALANRPTLPYGLGICIPFTIFVMPSNDMARAFSIDVTISNGLAIFVGVSVLFWIFQLITGPSLPLLMGRLMRATEHDLRHIGDHAEPEHYFNSRMGDRLLRISTYDRASSASRNVTDLALTGLNLGHVSLRLRRVVRRVAGETLEDELERVQQALASEFMAAYQGKEEGGFKSAYQQLLAGLAKYDPEREQYDMVLGMCERIALTLRRSANSIVQERSVNPL